MKLRPAQAGDIPGMLQLKQSLALAPSAVAGTSQRGGFLLGTTAEGYAMRILGGSSWVLEDAGAILGFAITLPDAVFRASEIWGRRDTVRWTIDTTPLEDANLAYFDQLAVARSLGARRWSIALALVSLLETLDTGLEYLITSTVREPFENRAAVPFIERIGGRVVGSLDEFYPEVGPLISDIWLVEPDGWRAFFDGHSQRAGHSLSRARAALAAARSESR